MLHFLVYSISQFKSLRLMIMDLTAFNKFDQTSMNFKIRLFYSPTTEKTVEWLFQICVIFAETSSYDRRLTRVGWYEYSI